MSNTGSNDHGPDDGQGLAALLAEVKTAERALARAVTLAGRLAGSGECERVEGLPLEHWLALAVRMPGADARALIGAGEILGDLPTVTAHFETGLVSWGQVRGIVSAARRLSKEQRAALDQRIAATVEQRGGLDGHDPDQLLWAVDQAADDLRQPRSLQKRDERRERASFLAVQQSLDGGLKLYGEYDAVTGAGVLNALDAAAGQPAKDDHGPDSGDDAGGDRSGAGVPITGRGRQHAAALARVCADWLGGSTRRPARPLLTVHVDLSDITPTPDGTVELNVRGGLPRVSAATVERLARDADLRAVLFDGARPLATSRKVRAEEVPEDVRRAVKARDRGCRFPGSQDPAGHCDVHHTIERERGGDHHPDRLLSLSRRFHTLAHRHGWTLRHDPDNGEVTATRRGRTWRSLPPATPLATARAPDPPTPTSRRRPATRRPGRRPPALLT